MYDIIFFTDIKSFYGEVAYMNRITYKFIKGIIKLSTKKPEFFGKENIIKDEPALFMSNHAGFYGPISVSCYFPEAGKIWANSMVIDTKPTREYVTRTLFKETLAWKSDFFAKIAGFIMGSLVSGLMQNENLITSYWDAERARQTIISGVNTAKSLEAQLMYARNVSEIDGKLSEDFKFDRGYSLVITQLLKKHNMVANLYPVAINRKKRTFSIGKPVKIDTDQSIKAELKRIDDYLIKAVKFGYNSPKELAEREFSE